MLRRVEITGLAVLLLAVVSAASGCCGAYGRPNGKRPMLPGFSCDFWHSFDKSRPKFPQRLAKRAARHGHKVSPEDVLPPARPYEPAPVVPPHSRFHPVPTNSVFGTRQEYHDPQLILRPRPFEPETPAPSRLEKRLPKLTPPHCPLPLDAPEANPSGLKWRVKGQVPSDDAAPAPLDAEPLPGNASPEGAKEKSFFREVTPGNTDGAMSPMPAANRLAEPPRPTHTLWFSYRRR